jgi:hypothetical protein
MFGYNSKYKIVTKKKKKLEKCSCNKGVEHIQNLMHERDIVSKTYQIFL